MLRRIACIRALTEEIGFNHLRTKRINGRTKISSGTYGGEVRSIFMVGETYLSWEDPVDRKPPAAGQPEFDTRGANVRAQMGAQLRRMYAGVVDEGVPVRFAEVLQGLDKREPDERPSK